MELDRADKHAVLNVTFERCHSIMVMLFLQGLERLVDYLENLTFTDTDVAYLREMAVYPEGF